MSFEIRNLREWFGDIDIYLFDQLLKGRFHNDMKVLDAGCGTGRNLIFLMRAGYSVYGVDQSAESIGQVRRLAATLAPALPESNFRVETVQELSFDADSFDAVISSAVLHFAAGEEEFAGMLTAMWRVLRSGGIFFSRLASTIGIEALVDPLGGRRFHLPDGTDRFLVDERFLLNAARELGGELIDPIKTTIVQNQRSMTTWCLRKR